MSLNVTSAEERYLIQIKAKLLEGKTQQQIADELGLARETVNRKIRRWMKTADFEEWLKEVWLTLFGEIRISNPEEAFKHVTSLLARSMTQRIEARTELVTPLRIIVEERKNDSTTAADNPPMGDA